MTEYTKEQVGKACLDSLKHWEGRPLPKIGCDKCALFRKHVGLDALGGLLNEAFLNVLPCQFALKNKDGLCPHNTARNQEKK